MQLAFTLLGRSQSTIIADILPIVSEYSCNILELRFTHLNGYQAAYLLIEGNWNQLAKLENALQNRAKAMDIKVHSQRQQAEDNFGAGMPYSLEVYSEDRENLVRCITEFLLRHQIQITEINGSRYRTCYVQTPVFSIKFTILVPPELSLLALRESFLDFCDEFNIDAILEPLKS